MSVILPLWLALTLALAPAAPASAPTVLAPASAPGSAGPFTASASSVATAPSAPTVLARAALAPASAPADTVSFDGAPGKFFSIAWYGDFEGDSYDELYYYSSDLTAPGYDGDKSGFYLEMRTIRPVSTQLAVHHCPIPYVLLGATAEQALATMQAMLDLFDAPRGTETGIPFIYATADMRGELGTATLSVVRHPIFLKKNVLQIDFPHEGFGIRGNFPDRELKALMKYLRRELEK